MNYNYLLIISIICIIYVYLNSFQSKKEHFRVLNLPSFDKFIKYTRGYTCNRKTDSLPQWAVNKYNYRSFCDKYPSGLDMEKISTVLLSTATKINKRKIKVVNSNSLNVRHISTDNVVLLRSNARMRSAPIIETKSLLKTEAIELLKKEPKYNYIAVGKGKELGKTIYYAGEISKIGPVTSDAKYDVYQKTSSVEYSITSWIKIDGLSGWRNIFHIGNRNNMRAPAVWIYPNNTKIGVSIWTSKSRGWGEWVSFGGQHDIPLNKWCHIAIAVSGRNIKCFINGNLLIDRDLRGYAKWAANNNAYIANPWYTAKDLHLSKFIWHPFSLNKDYIESVMYSSEPVKNFSHTNLNSKPDIQTLGKWREVKKGGYSPLEINEKNGLVFVDGFIRCPSSCIGLPCMMISQKYVPDRTVKLLVHGSGYGNDGRTKKVAAYLYVITIKPNGEVTLTDNTVEPRPKWGAGPGKYRNGITINLSSIRYTLYKGKSIKLSRSVSSSNDSSAPSVSKIGSLMAFSGHAKNVTWNRQITKNLPAMPAQPGSLHTGVSSEGNLVRIDIYRWYKSMYSKWRNGANNVFLDGIITNTLRGSKLTLYNGFKAHHSWWGVPSAINDNGIIKLSGLLDIPDTQPPGWSIHSRGCYRDNGRRDIGKYHGTGFTKKTCANRAAISGHKFFGLQWYGECRTGNNFGKYGKARNCNTKCNSNKNEICGGGWANSVYYLGDTWHHLGHLGANRAKWAPNNHMIFMCKGSWSNGFASICITKWGHIYLNSRDFPGKRNRHTYVSLESICYIKDSGKNYRIIKHNHECNSKDKYLGKKKSHEECATACANTKGCKYFIYGKGRKQGHCYQEYTSSSKCKEGWERDNYDFSEII